MMFAPKFSAAKFSVIVVPALLTWLGACAGPSLGDPPPGEHALKCQAGETVVCVTRQPSRLGKDEEQEFDFCRCESLERGLPY